MEVCEEFVKQMRTRVIKRMKAWLSQEEFDVQVAKQIALGRFTAGEVAEVLEGFDMETDMTSPVERALALVGEHGELTSSQLHAMLKLDADECPSEVLAEALEDGLLIKEGKYWTLPTERDTRQDSHYIPTPAQVAAFPKVARLELVTTVERRKTPRSRIEIAVEYLRGQPEGRATPAQMCSAIGVAARHGASAHLRPGIESGRLARVGTDWILGEKERMAA